MRFKLLLIGFGMLGASAVSVILAQTTTTSGPATPATTSRPGTSPLSTTSGTTAGGKVECLSCHPWDKVVAASATYKTPKGTVVNPHVYVPHSSKKEEDIAECVHCHAAHTLEPMPKAGEIELKAVNVNWCYDACHHKKNFLRCDKCH